MTLLRNIYCRQVKNDWGATIIEICECVHFWLFLTSVLFSIHENTHSWTLWRTLAHSASKQAPEPFLYCDNVF